VVAHGTSGLTAEVVAANDSRQRQSGARLREAFANAETAIKAFSHHAHLQDDTLRTEYLKIAATWESRQ
jgi:hypothetical protein